MDTYTLESVARGEGEMLVFLLRKPDGTLHQHVAPHWIFAQRSAEYDIDPCNWDTLLDIVLHEPFADSDGPGLYGSATVDDARETHLARIRRCKNTRVSVDCPEKNQLVDHLRAVAPIDPQDVKERRMRSAATRAKTGRVKEPRETKQATRVAPQVQWQAPDRNR